jgi:hypothetical protein
MERESHLDDRLLVLRQYFDAVEAARLFVELRDGTKWLRPGYEQDGKVTHLPRLTANYGERSYDYSGLVIV